MADKPATLDERLLELLELQRQQLEVLRDQKDTSEVQFSTISDQVVQNRAENSSRFNSIDTRLTRVEGNLDVVIAQQHHNTSIIAGIDARTGEQGRRISDISHRAIKLENGLAAVDAKTEKIQQRCAAHDEKFSHLNSTFAELKGRLEEHEDENTHEFGSAKEVSGELRLSDLRLKDELHRELQRELQVATADGKEMRTKIDQTWKVVAIFGGGLVALAGLIFGLIKILGS